MNTCPQTLPDRPEDVAALLAERYQRVLLLGRSGLDRRPLQEGFLAAASSHGFQASWLDADPGLPAVGPPGALSLAVGLQGWKPIALEPLCSLDAARFRLPLVEAAAALVERNTTGLLIASAPGPITGVAGTELIPALLRVVGAEAVVLLESDVDAALPAGMETDLPLWRWRAPIDPRGANAAARARARTRDWNAYLADAVSRGVSLESVKLLGTPPPLDVPEAWEGRQVALGRGAAWTGFGEIVTAGPDALEVRLVGSSDGADRLLVRDASRGANRELRTAPPVKPRAARVKQATRKNLEVQCGPVQANLVNGVTGDPLLLLRLRHRRGSLLFDVGESASLSRRLLHTVTSLFLTHAHLDHVAGFPYLLRSRLSAPLPPLKVYGPPGTRGHVAGFLSGVCWDRIGEDGPAFEIVEVFDSHLEISRLQAGERAAADLVTAPFDGVLLRTGDFTVRAARLDHRIPVLAFALQVTAQQKVVPTELARRRLNPGPWIGELKANVQQALWDRPVNLPDGTCERTDTLARALLRTTAGPKVVYATDFADHAANRATLAELATGAELMFCESTFRNADRELATATQHLTARACGEIAAAAQVERLVPFHFSKRYEGQLPEVYDEIRQAAGSVDLVQHHQLSPRTGSRRPVARPRG